jgi:DNA-binding IclR family transcriptional regulator
VVIPIVGQPVATSRLRLPVPVPMRGRVIASVAIWGPAYRITRARVTDLAAETRAAAGAISIRLGGSAA